MTQPALVPSIAAPNLNTALRVLRNHGLRLSAARRLVLAALYAADGPLSAEQIAAGVGGRVPESNVGSVYRNLETLERVGLVSHVHLAHSPSLFTIAAVGEREYLTCERCAEYVAVEPGELSEVRRTIRSRFGYAARFSHFPIVGLCRRCAAVAGR
jgi:Fur family transcriptional regulator, ferric uptake regulator